jgi:hypothetical protein
VSARRVSAGIASGIAALVLALSGTATAAASGLPSASSAPTAAVVPHAGSVDSSFAFCNTPKGGSTIACFAAELHYLSRTQFRLNTVQLEDSLCDGRSAIADVYDQNGWTGHEFVNSNGCHTTKDFGSVTISPSHAVQYVYIRLYACNRANCSSGVNSLRHANPFF